MSPSEVKAYWDEQYRKSATECTHVFRQGHCSNMRNCEIGLRTRRFHVLAGSVLTVWTRVENVLCSLTGYSQFRLQIIRVKTSDDQKIIGCVIPTTCLSQINSLLSSMSTKTYVHDHQVQKDVGLDEHNCILLDDEFSNHSIINRHDSPPSKGSKMIDKDDAECAKNMFNFNLANEKNLSSIPNQIFNYDFT